MAIKATFESGVTSVTLPPLYQWDYGQVLEIESAEKLPALVEVHFSCANMTEAEVRICAFADNDIATVDIPDSCLEQTANITAWVYDASERDVTDEAGNVQTIKCGRTIKSITIPIVARARPNRPVKVPAIVGDCYTQLITEINEAIGALKDGSVTVKKAVNAEMAEAANTAESATTAATAQSANTANTANTANFVSTANSAKFLTVGSFTNSTTDNPLDRSGVYILRFTAIQDSKTSTAVVFYENGVGSNEVVLEQSVSEDGTIEKMKKAYLTNNGLLLVALYDSQAEQKETTLGCLFSYCPIAFMD